MKHEPQYAILIRLVRFVERQAIVLGIDIEREITKIIEKIHDKAD